MRLAVLLLMKPASYKTCFHMSLTDSSKSVLGASTVYIALQISVLSTSTVHTALQISVLGTSTVHIALQVSMFYVPRQFT